MAKLRPDIQTIADENPELARLLEFKATFLWSDWKLFRAQDARGLANQIRTRTDFSVWVSLAMALYFFVFWGTEAIYLVAEGSLKMGITYLAVSLIALMAVVTTYKRRDRVTHRLNELGYPTTRKGIIQRVQGALKHNQNSTYADSQQDILEVATQDPDMAKLLELKMFFKYRDHQLFREKNKIELATNLLARVRRTQYLMIGFSLVGLSFAAIAMWISLSNDQGRNTQFLFYIGTTIPVVIGIIRQRKQKAFLRSLIEAE